MARRCVLTGKGVLTGNNVSHANNKTRRRFLPNLQDVTVLSDALDRSFRLRLSTRALRTIEKRGGIDAYLLKESSLDLPEDLRRLRKRIIAARAAAAEPGTAE